MMHHRVIAEFAASDQCTHLTGWLLYLSSFGFWCGYFGISCILTHSYVITINLGVLGLLAFYIRLRQIYHLVSCTKPHLFNSSALKRFLTLNTESLIVLRNANDIYGKALFYLLLTGLPTTSVFIMVAAFYQLKLLLKLAFIGAIFLGIFLMFIIHLAGVMLSFELHKPVKVLRKVFLVSRKIPDKRLKLKLVWYIEQFHSHNPYTGTYGKYGKVTFESFSKV